MGKHYIKKGLFWSDSDGDSDRNSQTVYKETGVFSSKKVKSKYDPSKGEFKK